MAIVYLLLGSNQGDRLKHLDLACEKLSAEVGKITKQSDVFETEAWGYEQQPHFVNQALCIHTELDPENLLNTIKLIEQDAGRVDLGKWQMRVLDIDILFYENFVVQTRNLQIPHSHLHKRRFALSPLEQIAPELIHPLLNLSIRQLLNQCEDEKQVFNIAELDG